MVQVEEMSETLLLLQTMARRRANPRRDVEQSWYRYWMNTQGFPRIGTNQSRGFGFERLDLAGRLPRRRLLVAVVCVPVGGMKC